jgi:hypothetical protein
MMAQEFQMERYDPLESPPPEEWLDMDEAERLGLVEDYHRRALYRARSFPSPCRRLAPILLISSFAIAWGGVSYFPAQKAVFGRPCNEAGRADPPADRRRQGVK